MFVIKYPLLYEERRMRKNERLSLNLCEGLPSPVVGIITVFNHYFFIL